MSGMSVMDGGDFTHFDLHFKFSTCGVQFSTPTQNN